MDDNLLGRNIKHLRIIHGETLDVLGNTIGFAKSTIKGYESGVRKPDPETLKAIAEHYGKTIDELLHTDLTGLEKISFNLDSPKKVVALQEAILPAHFISIFQRRYTSRQHNSGCFSRVYGRLETDRKARGSSRYHLEHLHLVVTDN